MGGKTISTSETKIEALQLQSSAYGVAIPVIGGVTRIAGNLIYQTDFKAMPSTTTQGGKGGGAKVQNTTYTYTTALLMALCHGQISAIPRVWVGKKKYSDDAGVTTVSTATETFVIAPGGGTATVAHAATFSANQAVESFISNGAESAPLVTQYAEGVDYTVKNGVYTFNVGGFTASITYQYVTTGSGSTALSKLGITLVSGSLAQAAPSWVTSRHPSDAMAYAGLAYVSADAYSLGTGAQVENHNFEVVGSGAYSLGSSIPDIDPSSFAVKVLQDARYGANFPSAYMNASQAWSNYCLANNLLMSPALTVQMSAAEFFSQMAMLTNTGIVWSGGRVKMVPYGDVAATGNGATFTPNVTPVYDLTDDAYIVQPGDAPVKVHRKKQSDAYNHLRLQFRNRANDYAAEIAEAKDQADIEFHGLRSASIVQADWICDATVARNVAQLMLQRSVNVRATYEFVLPYNFCCLEPMDMVTLTDAGLGLNKQPVRITTIEEADGELKFEAEEFALGVANAALYSTQIGSGFWTDFNAAPGSATAPVVFEAPMALTTTGLEVYIAATGTGSSWGGCRVWVSMDGTNYREAGKISGGSRYGTLQGAISSSVAVLLNTGTLTSGSAADATALTTLCYVGGSTPEYFAFQTATLTSALHYTLGGLVRGGYSTPGTNAHTAGDAFVRVDEAIVGSGPLDLSMIGKTIHIKLTSFNIFGLAEESLASVADYTYTITGYMTHLAPTAPTGLAYAVEASGVRFSCNKNPEITVIGYEWRLGATWAGAAVLDKLGGTSELWSTATAGSYTVWVAAVDDMGNESTPASLALTLTATDLGANGPQINLVATGDFFAFTDASTTTSGSPTISFTANLVNNPGTVAWSATAYDASNASLGSVTLGISSNTATLSSTQFTAPGATTVRYVIVSATLGGVTATKTIYRNDGGTNGNQFGYAYLYQWSSTTPSNPSTSGTSTYTWASGASSSYTGGSGWATTPPANPGTPGVQLWIATHQVSAAAGTTTTTVTWSAGSFTVQSVGSNGANGTQVGTPTVYQWAATIPSGPSGARTYTWATGGFGTAPAGWSLTPGTSPSAGFTLWAAKVVIVDGTAATTTAFNFTSATITAVGYAGSDGGSGSQGASARMCYSRIASNPTPTSGNITVSGDNRPTSTQSNTTWGLNVSWSASDPSPSSTNTLYQADGIYDPATGNTVWSTPYISSLKVGSLSAITTNTGALNVTGTITAGTSPAVSGTTMTGSGLAVQSGGEFALGNSTTNISFNGSAMTLNGNVVATGNIGSGAVNQSYTASSATGSVSVSVTVPASAASMVVVAYCGDPYVSGGTGEASAGVVVIPQGALTVNGSVVTTQQGTIIWATNSPTSGTYNVSVARGTGSVSGTMYLAVLIGKR